MNSIFLPGKRDKALERLTIGITESAKNCTIVIKKINSLCQQPEKYPDPYKLISEWAEYLFTNYFHDHIEEWISPNIITLEHEKELANTFFKYFASLTPFYYENKKIISPNFMKAQKYKWTADDYKELKLKLIQKWFYNEWDNWDGETKLKLGFKIEMDAQNVLKSIATSSKIKTSVWNKDKKIEKILYSDNLRSQINNVMPSYKHQYQTDLFLKYTDDFVKRLPSAFNRFDDNFYEVGSYLYKFFQWS